MERRQSSLVENRIGKTDKLVVFSAELYLEMCEINYVSYLKYEKRIKLIFSYRKRLKKKLRDHRIVLESVGTWSPRI